MTSRCALAIMVAALVPGILAAQGVRLRWEDIAPGSTAESAVLDAGSGAFMVLGLRPFAPTVAESLLTAAGYSPSSALLRMARSWVTAWANSARASQQMNGPVWTGRGMTVAASAGLVGRWRLVSYSVRPVAFASQNLAYTPSRSVVKAQTDFTDPWLIGIDRPYRYGRGAYYRVDAGESFVRVDARYVGAGLSNMPEVWGPSRTRDLVMAGTAGGFPHVFVQGLLPRSFGIGAIQARWIAGQLAASPYTPTADVSRNRIGVGAAGTFTPRGSRGLEIGATRFFHLNDSPAARDLSSMLLPFSGLLKTGLGNVDARGPRTYNQLASVFVRLAPPQSGVDVYGEFMREDHSVDLRDLTVEPDHNSAYMLGVRRHWGAAAKASDAEARGRTLTIEVTNGRITHLLRVRPQGAPYTHGAVPEGHTLRGIPLGASELAGGGGMFVTFDRGTVGNGWQFLGSVARVAQNEEGGVWNGKPAGFYTLGVSRRWTTMLRTWQVDFRLQPGFGDVPGTNIAAGINTWTP